MSLDFWIGFGLLVVVGAVYGEEEMDPNEKRSLEILQTLEETGDLSSDIELMDV